MSNGVVYLEGSQLHNINNVHRVIASRWNDNKTVIIISGRGQLESGKHEKRRASCAPASQYGLQPPTKNRYAGQIHADPQISGSHNSYVTIVGYPENSTRGTQGANGFRLRIAYEK